MTPADSRRQKRAKEVERLRRFARHRPDWAFRHNAPGFCSICRVDIESALDVHMMGYHLELGQLLRCPVEWCAVWKGSVSDCMGHFNEKHGGLGSRNSFPHGRSPGTCGRRLFVQMFRALQWIPACSMRPGVDQYKMK